MNKYAEQMEKVAVNRLAAYLAEHPQHVSVLEPLIGHTAGNAAEVVRGARKLKVSPEARRAAQRAMEDAKPALRSPAQYATGLWGHAERRLGDMVKGEGLTQVSREHPSVKDVLDSPNRSLSASLRAASSEHAAVHDPEMSGFYSESNKADASSRMRKAVEDTRGKAVVTRYDRNTPVHAANAHGAALRHSDFGSPEAIAKLRAQGPAPIHAGDKVHAISLSIPENPGNIPTDAHSYALSQMQQAHVAHHELDEVKASRVHVPLGSKEYFSHASPGVLAEEEKRWRGNPYAHLSTDVGNLVAARHSSGEAEAHRVLIGNKNTDAKWGAMGTSSRQVRKAYQMDPAAAHEHFKAHVYEKGWGGDNEVVREANEVLARRYGTFSQ